MFNKFKWETTLKQHSRSRRAGRKRELMQDLGGGKKRRKYIRKGDVRASVAQV